MPLFEEDQPHGRESVIESLKGFNARVEHYETLIKRAHDQYDEFLKQSAKTDRLDKILQQL